MVDIKLITPEELEERINARDESLQIIDVREDEEVETGTIKDAVHIRLKEIPARVNEVDKSKTIVTVCRSGRRSAKAAEFLQSEGYDVYNLFGGMLKWTGEVLSFPIS